MTKRLPMNETIGFYISREGKKRMRTLLLLALALLAGSCPAADKLEWSPVIQYPEHAGTEWYEHCSTATINGHGGWRPPTEDEIYQHFLDTVPPQHEIYYVVPDKSSQYPRFHKCVFNLHGKFYDDRELHGCGHSSHSLPSQICVFGKASTEKTKPEQAVTKRVESNAAPIILHAKNLDDEKAKAEAARKKAEDDAKAYEKARQQKVAQARANDELKRLDQDLKQRQACMKPEVRKQNIGCMCDRFFPPPPDDGKGGARGCSQ
jgi:hypothetical protein